MVSVGVKQGTSPDKVVGETGIETETETETKTQTQTDKTEHGLDRNRNKERMTGWCGGRGWGATYGTTMPGVSCSSTDGGPSRTGRRLSSARCMDPALVTDRWKGMAASVVPGCAETVVWR